MIDSLCHARNGNIEQPGCGMVWPGHSAVAVEERVDGLELGVNKRAFYQGRHRRIVVHKHLKIAEGTVHFVNGRRNEAGLTQRAALRSDPVLGPAELARFLLASSNALQQLGVDLAYQTHRQRKLGDTRQAIVHRVDVVDDLGDIAWNAAPWGVGFVLQHVDKRRLSPLNLRTQDGLLAHVHGDKQVRIWKRRGYAIEPAQPMRGDRRQLRQLVVHLDWRIGGYRCGDECPVARGLPHIGSGPAWY